MLELTVKLNGGEEASATVSLPWEMRLKSRLRIRLDDGREAGIFLESGSILRGGDILAGNTGERVRVIASPELVSTVATEDPLLLARLCYHLGNRHVALEIAPGRVKYLHDHVLDAMVLQLGCSVTVEEKPFEPEPGAYRSHGQHHA